MNTIKLNTLGDKVIVRKAAENGGNAGGDTGGSGGGSASGSGLTYYKLPTYTTLEEVSETDKAVVYNAARLKVEMSGVSMIGLTYIGGGIYREDNILTVRAFAIDKSARFIMAIGGQRSDITLEEYLEEYCASTGGSLSNYEEITEEEFYNTAV